MAKTDFILRRWPRGDGKSRFLYFRIVLALFCSSIGKYRCRPRFSDFGEIKPATEDTLE